VLIARRDFDVIERGHDLFLRLDVGVYLLLMSLDFNNSALSDITFFDSGASRRFQQLALIFV
jgi:hypothetical protein